MELHTALFNEHQKLNARLVPFAGWMMPLHYGSQIEEHHAVRRAAGMFDVSHMCPVDISGPDATKFLSILIANDVNKLKQPGRALYSCMLNQRGGVIDDLIVYFRGENNYRLVVNAGTTEKDLTWINTQALDYSVNIKIQRRSDLSILAVQGPTARNFIAAQSLLPEDLNKKILTIPPFYALEASNYFIGRTGYTGEDGVELILPHSEIIELWQNLLKLGVQPCGLGARDTLRLEAGLNLYGHDLDEDTSPLESGLTWTIAWNPVEREFIGRAALTAQRNNPDLRRFIGLVLTGSGVIREHQNVWAQDQKIGVVTSGGFSPTLGRSIALARVTPEVGETCLVEIRGKLIPAQVVQPPFVRNGNILIKI